MSVCVCNLKKRVTRSRCSGTVWWLKFSSPWCKKYSGGCEERWGGQETGSSVGWGNSPETVWIITLSLPWQPQRPFPFSACWSCVAAHLLSHVHLEGEDVFQTESIRNTTMANTVFKGKITNLSYRFSFICGKETGQQTCTLFYCISFLRAVKIMASIRVRSYKSLKKKIPLHFSCCV